MVSMYLRFYSVLLATHGVIESNIFLFGCSFPR
jgi:hypothetical protein